MVAFRRAVMVALMSNKVAEVTAGAGCMCGPNHPYCFGGDHHCYTDPNSHDSSRNTCAGACTSDYTANPEEYHYEQEEAAREQQQPRPTAPPITQADVDRAVQDEKSALTEAWQAVTDTQAYYSWLQADGNSEAYQERVAEQIKTKAFAKVDDFRHRVEMNLSSKVTAVSALSAKLASEAGGGTPTDQAQLTGLLHDVEIDRNRLKAFGLNKKIEEMQVVWEEALEKEQKRMAMLRHRNLESRLYFLRAVKFASHIQRKWGTHPENICNGGCEGVFNSLEQTVEPVQDAAKDQIRTVYDGVHSRVQHRIQLLRNAAAGTGGDSFFLYA